MKRCATCGRIYPDESTFCFLSGDTLAPCADPLLGRTLQGGYLLEELVSETPASRVYRSRRRLLSQQCVVRVQTSPLESHEHAPFLAAVERSHACTHDNIEETLSGGITAEGCTYLVTRDSVSRPLSELVAAGPMDDGEVVGALRQLLKALTQIHDLGFCHGSLSCETTQISANGHVESSQVAVARIALGDPWQDDPSLLAAQHFLAPEVTREEPASQAADLYALGMVAFGLWAGRLPVAVEKVSDLGQWLANANINVASQLSRLKEPLKHWLSRLVERDPLKRLHDAREALRALERACQAAAVVPAPDPGKADFKGKPLPSDEHDSWQCFAGQFQTLLDIGFANGAPEPTRNTLAIILARVERLAELTSEAKDQERLLSDGASRAKQTRAAVASQIDAILESSNTLRDELSPLQVAAERHANKSTAFAERFTELHDALRQLEGENAEPTPSAELAQAYRAIAEVVDGWHALQGARQVCEKSASDKRDALEHVDEEIEVLLQSLRMAGANQKAERSAGAQELERLTAESHGIEMDLLDLAGRFCAPLRSKPELGRAFRKLEETR